MTYTTLNKIRSHGPCKAGWIKLLKGLNKSGPDDEPLSLQRIMAINGIRDAAWALRTIDATDSELRLFACDCAQLVTHLNNDPHVQEAINTARRYALGKATRRELEASTSAAYAAYASATSAAYAAYASVATSAAASDSASAAYAASVAATSASDSAAADSNTDIKNNIQDLFIKYFCYDQNS